jgi:hypothetical protein
MGSFARRALRWRIAPGYLLAALLLVPGLAFLAACAYARLGGPAASLAVPVAQIPMLFVVMLFMGGSVNEEFGWAYAIDRLPRERGLLAAAVQMGVIWGCWHLPLFYIVGVTQSFLPFWAFLLFAVALRLWFVWAYEGSGKSMLATLLFHTTTNMSLNLFVLVDRSPGGNDLADGKSPAQVRDAFGAFVTQARHWAGQVPFAYLSIKPNLSRRRQLPRIRQANTLIRACAEERGVEYLDVHTPMLGADGEADPRWFDVDGLHLNAVGYALWTGMVRDWLAQRGLL